MEDKRRGSTFMIRENFWRIKKRINFTRLPRKTAKGNFSLLTLAWLSWRFFFFFLRRRRFFSNFPPGKVVGDEMCENGCVMARENKDHISQSCGNFSSKSRPRSFKGWGHVMMEPTGRLFLFFNGFRRKGKRGKGVPEDELLNVIRLLGSRLKFKKSEIDLL